MISVTVAINDEIKALQIYSICSANLITITFSNGYYNNFSSLMSPSESALALPFLYL